MTWRKGHGRIDFVSLFFWLKTSNLAKKQQTKLKTLKNLQSQALDLKVNFST